MRRPIPFVFISAVAVAATLVLAGAGVSSRALADDALMVDVSTVKRTLPATFHGINYVGFWDTAQGSAASNAALARTGIKTIRFPGGDPGDFYDWQCPYYTDAQTPSCPSAPVGSSWSSTSPLDVWGYAKKIGGTVIFQTNYEGNLPDPPGKSYAVNSPENAGAWAAYAKAQGMSALFEIGNEQDIHMTSVHDANFQPYIDAFTAQATAIHAADATARVIGPTGTNEYFWWALDSLGMFLARTGNKTGSGQVDGVSLHFYSGSDWDSTVGVAQYWLGSGGPWQFIASTIAANDTRALPVYISEWHAGPGNAAFNATIANALVTADLIGAFAQSGVAGHQYFTTHGVETDPNSWGLLYGAGESRAADSPTPTYYAMALWGAMGDRVLGLTQSADPKQVVSSYATARSDGSVQVLAINKSPSAQTVTVGFAGFDPSGRAVDVHTLSPGGADRTSRDAIYNGARNPAPGSLPAPATKTAAGASFSQSVPPSSIVLMSFRGDGTIAPAGTGGSGAGGAAGTGGSGAAGDAGTGGRARDGGGSDGTPDAGHLAGSGGGCGCSAGGGARPGLGLPIALAASVLLLRRARTGRRRR